MHAVDDYQAKITFWLRHPQVVPAPTAVFLPNFKSRRFASHAEMDAWKGEQLLILAEQAWKHEHRKLEMNP